MALDADIKVQLGQYLELLESDLIFKADLATNEHSQKVREFLEEIVTMSPRLSLLETDLGQRKPTFEIIRPDGTSGVSFAGLPLGHEFTSFVLALLQVSGRSPKIDAEMVERIQSINQELHFETYVSLTCHNCPDVVQALNIMSVLNPKISHTMIEGGMFKEEVEAKKIMAVPTVFLNGEEFVSGRMTIEQLVDKVASPLPDDSFAKKGIFDVLVIGGGPAGNSAAIYAARKGIKTGMLVETFGGQVMETVGIENMIGQTYTEGPKLMAHVENHTKSYPIDIMKNQRAKSIRKTDLVEVELENGHILKAKTVILAVGARWRNVNVPGEQELRNKGVTYCPHCDGPLFEGKKVAVIGGGNSGVEAAIDLAGLADHVYLLEFMETLKADQVLQERLHNLSNTTVLTNVATKEIVGHDEVEGLIYTDRTTQKEFPLDIEGVFVQIGLVPNTNWLADSGLELTKAGEIVVDSRGATNIDGIFAAGDCTNSAYKQIIISMGSGATAALGAFDYLIRQ